MPEQTVVEATLADIAEKARHLQSPAITVVGEVVALREEIEWVNSNQLPVVSYQ
jgi:uroporphyrinogen III methyltransferase/synthase